MPRGGRAGTPDFRGSRARRRKAAFLLLGCPSRLDPVKDSEQEIRKHDDLGGHRRLIVRNFAVTARIAKDAMCTPEERSRSLLLRGRKFRVSKRTPSENAFRIMEVPWSFFDDPDNSRTRISTSRIAIKIALSNSPDSRWTDNSWMRVCGHTPH
ncbi:MAG TPA: hypothetical protein VIL91_09585 [Gaiellaceae bacterium]|jgi:hypothetical protein